MDSETATEPPPPEDVPILGENNKTPDKTMADKDNATSDHQTERAVLADSDGGDRQVIHRSARPIKQSAPSDEAKEIKQRSTSFHESSMTSPPLNDDNIAQAEAFLRNSEIHDVPTESKRKYLESKGGMTPGEIDAALERVAGKVGVTAADDDEARNSSRSRDREHDGRYQSSQRRHDDQSRERQGHRRDPNQYDQDDDSYGNHRRGPVSERRPPPQYPIPHDSNNINNMPTYNMNSAPGYAEREEITASSSLLPAWAGGFSLGVFFLAAVRWLNGGDFVLFPLPSASEPLVAREEEPLFSIKEEDTDESDSQQQKEDDLQENHAEYDENELEPNEYDGLNTILDGTANAQSFHPDNSPPSNNELGLEIRALTSAIHSYRDVQERANRAVSAEKGKGMTDGAMDFLRLKKSKSGVDLSQTGTDVCLEGKEISTVVSLLTEVSGDLSQLKQSISQGGIGNEHSANLAGDSEGANEADTGGKGDENPVNQIDKVMGKIEKMLAVVKKLKSNEKDRMDSNGKNSNGVQDAGEKESKSISSKPDATSMESPTPSIQPDEKTQQSENPPQQPDNEAAQSNEQLEDALKILADSNNAADLKVGAQMLYLYCFNISENPRVPRYRKIYTNNNNYRNKVGNLVGVKDFLSAVGFVERTNFFEWASSQSDDASLVTKSRLDFALVALDLMKNGSKPQNEELVLPSESNTFASAAPELPLSTVVSAVVSAADVGKCVDLN